MIHLSRAILESKLHYLKSYKFKHINCILFACLIQHVQAMNFNKEG